MVISFSVFHKETTGEISSSGKKRIFRLINDIENPGIDGAVKWSGIPDPEIETLICEQLSGHVLLKIVQFYLYSAYSYI